jgi:hypothetical protein
MSAFFQPHDGASLDVRRIDLLRRKPQRICATLPWALHQTLIDRADYEGRSLSNLIAHLLEGSIKN